MTSADKILPDTSSESNHTTPTIFSLFPHIHLLLLLSLVLLSAVIKQLLVHLHKELQSIVDKPMDCPARGNSSISSDMWTDGFSLLVLWIWYVLKGSYDAILKIIIWCNRICWHALMLKKHMNFQILCIIVGPLCPASLKRIVFLQSPSFRQALSDLMGQLETVHCDWPNTTSTCRKCNAPLHNRKLQLSS